MAIPRASTISRSSRRVSWVCCEIVSHGWRISPNCWGSPSRAPAGSWIGPSSAAWFAATRSRSVTTVRFTYRLTDNGRQLAERVTAHIAARVNAVAADLSEANRARLSTLLSDLVIRDADQRGKDLGPLPMGLAL